MKSSPLTFVHQSHVLRHVASGAQAEKRNERLGMTAIQRFELERQSVFRQLGANSHLQGPGVDRQVAFPTLMCTPGFGH